MKISDVLLRKNAYAQTQEYVSVAYPETSERGGARNMKYKPPGTAAIFFYLFFTGRGGGWHGPLGSPLDPLLCMMSQRITDSYQCNS